MGTAAQIRSYRVRAGRSAEDVAARLGLNAAWYHDLEHHDDELASTLTLFQAMELASILGVRLRDLLGETEWPDDVVPIVDLPSHITAHVTRAGISIEQFEEEVGWELGEFLQSPLKVAAESPIVFIQAVATHVGIDWRSVVPDEGAV